MFKDKFEVWYTCFTFFIIAAIDRYELAMFFLSPHPPFMGFDMLKDKLEV
jgi:hypothetical protein